MGGGGGGGVRAGGWGKESDTNPTTTTESPSCTVEVVVPSLVSFLQLMLNDVG